MLQALQEQRHKGTSSVQEEYWDCSGLGAVQMWEVTCWGLEKSQERDFEKAVGCVSPRCLCITSPALGCPWRCVHIMPVCTADVPPSSWGLRPTSYIFYCNSKIFLFPISCTVLNKTWMNNYCSPHSELQLIWTKYSTLISVFMRKRTLFWRIWLVLFSSRMFLSTFIAGKWDLEVCGETSNSKSLECFQDFILTEENKLQHKGSLWASYSHLLRINERWQQTKYQLYLLSHLFK